MDRTVIWQVATRYLRGRGSANAAPVLSRISMVAIAVGSAAMIIMFSAFNGIGMLIKDQYKAFYPAVKVSAVKGKFFSDSLIDLNRLRKVPGVTAVTTTIEDAALAGDENEFSASATQQHIVQVKGIEPNYFKVNDIANYIDQQGFDTLSVKEPYTAMMGIGISHVLGAEVDNSFSSIILYYQNPEVTNPEADPANAFQTLKLHPAATFTSEAEFDEKYVLAPLPLVQQLFHAERKYSAIEIDADPAMVEQVRDEVRRVAGPGFRVQTRFEQNQTLYMVMGGEKWAIYAILLFVLFIASFNMVAALSMLVVEKQKDIAILRAMGADRNTLRGIFLLEGVLWSLIGGVTGLVLGTCICLLQEKTGLVKMQDGMTADAFPISVTVPDILLVLVTIITVGFLAAWYPAARAGRIREVNLKSN